MRSQDIYERILVTFSIILISYCAIYGFPGTCPPDDVDTVVETGVETVQEPSTIQKSEPFWKTSQLRVERSDIIYSKSRGTVPYVNEEYKVIFFHVAKAASSEWIRFFARLQGNHEWCGANIHLDEVNKIKKLSDYSRSEATQMMTNSEWTKAIFVRNPKTRVLSAFLDKAIHHSKVFQKKYCHSYENNGGNKEYCQKHHREFEFFVHNITTVSWENVHWRPIYTRIDTKWWPYINYVANMENLSEDAKHFLQSLKSKEDGVSAWDRIGSTGWSGNERDCNTMGTKAFLEKKDEIHKTNAEDKLREYYTPELEKVVERLYWDDYNNPYFTFSPLILYNRHNNSSSDDDDTGDDDNGDDVGAE